MLPIVCFGEALIDCLNTGNSEADGMALPEFRHYPGGAPANVAVALAKLNAKSYFAGKIGVDAFGDQLQTAMQTYGVDITHLERSVDYETTLAFVHRDADGERSFTFRRRDTADLHYLASEFDWSQHEAPGIFHVCSNTLCEEGIYQTTLALLQQAKQLGWKVCFDINYRLPLWEDVSQAAERVAAILTAADIVKSSMEDVEAIWPELTREDFIKHWSEDDRVLYITDGGEPVSVWVGGQEAVVDIPETKVVDTTAAGDSFIAGVLYALSKQDVTSITVSDAEKAAKLGVLCGGITVSREGSYPSLPTPADIPANLLG